MRRCTSVTCPQAVQGPTLGVTSAKGGVESLYVFLGVGCREFSDSWSYHLTRTKPPHQRVQLQESWVALPHGDIYARFAYIVDMGEGDTYAANNCALVSCACFGTYAKRLGEPTGVTPQNSTQEGCISHTGQ